MTTHDHKPPSSPVCYAAQADDRYMGYLDETELVQALTRLLEAERAGARIGVRLVQTADDPDATALAATLRRDEARWCRMLSQALRRLGAEPSPKVGDFYDKVMAVDGFDARLALVNRGQAWVVRKLKILLPKIRHDQLHADLRAMLEAHAVNIELTESALGRRSRRSGDAAPAGDDDDRR
jgi:hypothetical protein